MADLKTIFSIGKDGVVRKAWRHFRKKTLLTLHLKRAAMARKSLKGPVIAITGSSTKSTTSGLLAHVLAGSGKVKAQIFQNTVDHLPKFMLRGRQDQDYTVLELGVGAVGTMLPMAQVVRPDLSIVTMIGLEHYSAFRSREAVAAEKGILVDFLQPGGKALLNADDDLAMAMAARTRAEIVTFGQSAAAHYRLIDAECRLPEPMRMTVACKRGTFKIKTQFNGSYFWLPVLAAFAAAVELGVEPEQAAERVSTFEPANNRCNLINVPGGPVFLLDATKAPFGTLFLPFETVAAADAPRKTIVVGQLSDYPGNATAKYRAAYKRASECADRVIFVGDKRSRSGANAEAKQRGQFVEAVDAKAVFDILKADHVPGELILLKSAGNLHLERVALAFVSDIKCWRNGCGVAGGCLPCGLWGVEHSMQASAKRALRRRKLAGRIRDWFARRKEN